MTDYVIPSNDSGDYISKRELFLKHFPNGNNVKFARAPGRVNIIGEHIDYCGYSVLPMAIDKAIVMAYSINDENKIRLRNSNQKYKDIDISIDDFEINSSKPLWHDYFLCGYKGILEYMAEIKMEIPKISFDILVSGTVPPNAGLSSSSAMVVCSALVTMEVFELKINKRKLADICAKCERYIGTLGGGMDQCVSIMAEKGSAMLINFGEPKLQIEYISLPEHLRFVVSNSREQMNKAASAQFNMRVMESRLTAKVILKLLKPEFDHNKYTRMADVQKELGITHTDLLSHVETLMKSESYSRQEITKILEIDDQEFSNLLSNNTKSMEIFKLKQRAIHILKEIGHVNQFIDQIQGNSEGGDKLDQMLGKLMNDSYVSCRDNYEASSDNLEKLVQLCLKSGALGSRFTGAGWGGCVISLVHKDQVGHFISQLSHEFYQDCAPEEVAQYLFVTSPCEGVTLTEA